jgi:hypothetical protein
MKTVTEAIVVAEHTLQSIDAQQDLARAPLLYGPFDDSHLPEIQPLIRRNGKDNIVFKTESGDVYVLEARDFSSETRSWGFARKGESITVGDLSGTVIDVDNEWFTERNFEQNHSLAGLEKMAQKARDKKAGR